MTPAVELVALAHAAATWVMVGVIWYVQLVHYPMMARVRTEPAGSFEAFERFHQRRTSMIVAPAMLVELATAVALVAMPGSASTPSVALAWAGLALVAFNWVSTAAVQMPCHKKLEAGFDPAVHARLVRTNRWRTAAWSLRGVVAGALLAA